MQFIAACKKALFLTITFRTVCFLDEPILLTDDAMLRQHLHGLYPGRVHSLILVLRHRVQLGQLHLESHGQVGVLAHDAAVLY